MAIGNLGLPDLKPIQPEFQSIVSARKPAKWGCWLHLARLSWVVVSEAYDYSCLV